MLDFWLSKQQMIVVKQTIFTFSHSRNVNVHLQFENDQCCISTHKEAGIGQHTAVPTLKGRHLLVQDSSPASSLNEA